MVLSFLTIAPNPIAVALDNPALPTLEVLPIAVFW
jgi:hypothetical protein